MNQLMFDTRSRLPRPWREPGVEEVVDAGVLVARCGGRSAACSTPGCRRRRSCRGRRTSCRRSSSSARPRWTAARVPGDEEDVALGGDRVGAPSSARPWSCGVVEQAVDGLVAAEVDDAQRRRRPARRATTRPGPATTSSSDRRSSRRPGQAGRRCSRRPAAARASTSRQRVVGRARRRRHAVQSHRSTPCSSGRSSSGCGVLASEHDARPSRRAARRACRAAASPSKRERAVVADARRLNRLTPGGDVAPVEPVLGRGERRAARGRSASAPWTPPCAVAGSSADARSCAPHRASWRALVSATIVISTRPMSDSSSGAGAEVGLPLHLDGVGDVEPLGRVARRCSTRRCDAGVAVDVGDAQDACRGAAGGRRSRRRRSSRPSTTSAASTPAGQVDGAGAGTVAPRRRRAARPGDRAWSRAPCERRRARLRSSRSRRPLGRLSMVHRNSAVSAARRRGAMPHGHEFTRRKRDASHRRTALARAPIADAADARPPCRRPRRPVARASTPRPVVGDPTDEILAAASRLFGERGVERHDDVAASPPRSGCSSRRSTTTSAARRRSSPRSWPGPTSCRSSWSSGSQRRAAARPPCALFRFVRGDVDALCALPFDINEVHRDRGPRPRALRRATGRSAAACERRLAVDRPRRASATASCATSTPGSTALTIMSNDEGVQNWYRLDTRRSRDPAAIGRSLADARRRRPAGVGRRSTTCAEGRRPTLGRRRRAELSNQLRNGHAPFASRETQPKQTIPTFGRVGDRAAARRS